MLNFGKVNVPRKISPCPITEAVVELRFETNHPPEVVIGIIFNKLRQKFPNFEKLPIVEIPAFMRDNDPALMFSPHYRLTNDDFKFQFGSKSFSLVCSQDYKGWNKYFEQIEWVFNAIKELEIIKNPFRIGLRYISFFENINIFENIKINLSLAENNLIKCQNVLRTEFEYNTFNCIIHLANKAILNGNKSGSSIDIDVASEKVSNIMMDFKKVINSAHEVEKILFFGMLNEAFLNLYNPE